jgi:adenine deaminase
LIPLLKDFPEQIMFCCDDKHPDNLLESHINEHVRRAVAYGHDVFDVLRAASYNVIQHYNLPIGLLQVGDSADFLEVSNLTSFQVQNTIIRGQLVAENGISYLNKVDAPILNQFNTSLKSPNDFLLSTQSEKVRVIEALDGQLITKELQLHPTDPDVLKIAVVNRYHEAPISVAYIKNFGLTSGAIAGSVAHDCHNIVAVGTNDEDLCQAVNLIIEHKGGISLTNGDETHVLPLPIAGIMTNQSAEEVAEAYVRMDRRAKELGSTLRAPYMTLSFMALLVIPELKLSDLGLFDGKKFEFVGIEI